MSLSFQLFVILISCSLSWSTQLTHTSLYSCSSNTFVVNKQNNDVIVSANDVIFQFDDKLQLKARYDYVTRACDVKSPPKCSSGAPQVNSSLLMIDYTSGWLVACGNYTSGFCFRHNLTNICHVVALNNNATTDRITSIEGSVGFVSPSNHLFYFARSLDDQVSDTEQLMSVKQWNARMTGFDFRSNKKSFLNIAEKFRDDWKLYFRLGFNFNGFSYFLFDQRKVTKDKWTVKVGRVCDRDEVFDSYTEVELRCDTNIKKQGRNLMVVDAHLSYLSEHAEKFYVDHYIRKLSWSKQPYLNILFGVVTKGKKIPDYNQNTFWCQYALKKVSSVLDHAFLTCNGQNDDLMEETSKLFHEKTTPCFDKTQKMPPKVSTCPTSPNSAHVHYIKASDPIKATDLLYSLDNYKDPDLAKSFRSFITFQVNYTHIDDVTSSRSNRTSVVVAFGDNHGNVLLHHSDLESGVKPISFVNVTTAAQGAIRKLEYDVTNREFIVLGEDDVYIIKLEYFCREATSCFDCVHRSFLGCGYCDDIEECEFEESCPSNYLWTMNRCRPILNGLKTISGPVEGQTEIHISGNNLGCINESDNPQVPLWGNSPDGRVKVAVCSVKWNELVCVTVPQKSNFVADHISVHINVSCIVSEKHIEGNATSSGNFSFVNVKINGFSPTYGAQTGGTVVNVTGENIDSGSKVKLVISGRECRVQDRDRKSLRCKIAEDDESSGGDFEKDEEDDDGSYIYIDNFKYNFTQNFKFQDDPLILGSGTKMKSIVRLGSNLPLIFF